MRHKVDGDTIGRASALVALMLLSLSPVRAAVTVGHDAASATSGIQQAIDALGPEGGAVHIPAGRFVLSAPITLPTDRPVALLGEGAATVLVADDEYTLTLATDANARDTAILVNEASAVKPGDFLWIKSDRFRKWEATRVTVKAIEGQTVRLNGRLNRNYTVAEHAVAIHSFPIIYGMKVRDVLIRDLNVVGSLRQAAFQGFGKWYANPTILVYGKRARVIDVDVEDSPSDAISLQQNGRYVVRGCRVRNAAQMGIHIGGNATEVVISSNTIQQAGVWGIYLCNGAQQVAIADNLVLDVGLHETAKGPVQWEYGGNQPLRENPGFRRFAWNYACAAIGGLGGGGKTDRHNTISGNVIRRSRGAGISFLRWGGSTPKEVRPGAYYAINGNTIQEVGYAGIHLYAAEAVNVTGNTIAQAGEGIAVVKARHCLVSNNLVREAEVGIGVRTMDGWPGEEGPECLENVIRGNTLIQVVRGIDLAEDAPQNRVVENDVLGESRTDTVAE